ncbi:MAG: putative membrane protein YccC [Actinomycetes bacterium]|jgi:uncharacterized membrane protein YccC
MEATHVQDPGHVILYRALRVAVVLPVLLYVVGFVFGLEYGAPYAAFGSFALLAFADFGGPNRDRVYAYLVTGGAGLIAIVLGTLAAYTTVASVVATFLVGVGLTYSGVLRGYVATAMLPVLLPFVIAVTSGADGLSQLPERLLGFAIAIVVSAAAAVLLWPVHMRTALRARVADSLMASANLIQAIWPDPGHPLTRTVDVDARMRELTQAHHKLREQYDGHLLRPGGATARDRALMQLVDELGRLRLFLKWRSQPEILAFPPNAELAKTTAQTLSKCAASIYGDGPCPDPRQVSVARENHRNAAEIFVTEQLSAGDSARVKHLIDTGFQLRIAALFCEIIARNTRVATGEKPDEDVLAIAGVALEISEPTARTILRSNLTLQSPWTRNSLRAGLALAIAVGVVAFTQVDHGFWVVLGTIAALRLDVAGTTKAALRAIFGTAIGFAIGSAILFLLGSNEQALWILLPIAVFLSGFTPAAIGLIVGQASFTIFVIVLYSIIIGPTFQTGQERIIDVAIGLVISLFVSLLMWPRGVAAKMRETLSASLSASTDYMVAAYERLTLGPITEAELEKAHTLAANSGTAVYETFDLTLSQSRSDPAQVAAWSFIVNANGHILTGAELVTWISQSGRAPVGFPDYNQRLMTAAHAVKGRIDISVDTLDRTFDTNRAAATMSNDSLMTGLPGDSAVVPGDPLHSLDQCVNSCLRQLEGQKSSAEFSTGANAISMIWAQDWLIHLNWVSDQVSLVTRRTAAQTSTGPTTPPPTAPVS